LKLYQLPAHRLSQLLKERKISVEEIVTSFLHQIEMVEDKIKAFLFLDKEEALKEARQWNRIISEKSRNNYHRKDQLRRVRHGLLH